MRQLLPTSEWTPPNNLIIVATYYRSGSHHLCSLMESTGKLGKPDEYLNPQNRYIKNNTNHETLQVAAFLNDVSGHFMTSNGVASMKVFPSTFEKLLQDIDLKAWFPKIHFVWLQRADILGQAVSLSVAGKTGEWFHNSQAPSRPSQSRQWDFEATLQHCSDATFYWARFFSQNGIVPLIVTYEELCKNPSVEIRKIADFSGVKLPKQIQLKSKFKKQESVEKIELRASHLATFEGIQPVGNPRTRAVPRKIDNLIKFVKKKPLPY